MSCKTWGMILDLHDWQSRGRRGFRISIGEAGACTVELYDDGLLLVAKSASTFDAAVCAAVSAALLDEHGATTKRCPSLQWRAA